jgi:hypothetical protein
MKIYTETVTCDVCGCEGVATPKTAGLQWYKDSFICHSDPRVCAENLKRKEIEQKRNQNGGH